MTHLMKMGGRIAGAVVVLAVVLQFVPQRALAAGPTTVDVAKFVSVNSGTFGTSASATNGDTLTYGVQYANTGNMNAATGASITDTLQPGQTLQAFTPGCTQGMSGSLVMVTCPLGDLPPSGMSGSSGTVFIQTTVNNGFSGNIPNSAQLSATNATTDTSNTTTVCVNTCTTPSGITLQKLVSVNNSPYATTAGANFGDFLTYDLKFTNGTGSTLNGVTVSDVLQPGQNLVGYPTSSCSLNTVSNTVTCNLGNVPAFSIVRAFIQTQVNTSGPATITNQSAASWGSNSVTSNTTSVSVPTTTQVTTGTFALCGFVNAYTPAGTSAGSITISDVSVAIAPNTVPNGTIAMGSNICVTFTFNGSGQANALSVSPNLAVFGSACGFYSPGTTAGTINVSGISITLAPGANFVPLLQVGAFYCFLLTPGGQAYAAVSGIPTSAAVAPHHAYRSSPVEV